MSRRRAAPKREILADPRYGSKLVTKFINFIMVGGKKSIAQAIVYGALEKVSKEKNKEPVDILEEVIKIIGPEVEVKSRRVGGSNYQVPMEVRAVRRVALAMRWVRDYAKKRRDAKTMTDRLAKEMIDILDGNSRSGALGKLRDVLAMAEANKAFSHYSW